MPLGVRGSTPAPGAEFIRYGGNTSCVAVFADGAAVPRLVLDAGTGLRSLPALLGDRPFEGSIVLSHLHWDHVQGLPFCSSIDRPDAQVTLFVPVPDHTTDPAALLARSFSPPHFPIGVDGLRGRWRIRALRPGQVDDGLRCGEIAHKGGTAFGLRVQLDGRDLAYLPDHALHGATDPAAVDVAVDIAAGADVLLHDGQFTLAEEATARDYGHATIEHTVRFADAAAIGRLVVTHHAPNRTDDQLDALARQFDRTDTGRPVEFAREGAVYTVE